MSEKRARAAALRQKMVERDRSPRTWTWNRRSSSALFKEESELEVWKQDRDGRFALLKTYPICRWSGELGPEDQGRRPPGAGGLLHDHARPDESELAATTSSFNIGFPNAYDRAQRPHRRVPHGARRLLVARLLRHDRRADRGNLRARARVVLRRPDVLPGAGLSVPDDAAELRQASQQPAHGVLEDAQEGQRPFPRSRSARAQGRTSARSATCSTPSRGAARRCRSARPAKCPAYEVPARISPARCAEKQQHDELRVRRADPPQRRAVAPVAHRRRRRHASGVRRRGEDESDRRRAAGGLFVTTPPGHHSGRPVRPPRIPSLPTRPVATGLLRRRSAGEGSASIWQMRQRGRRRARAHRRPAASSAACSLEDEAGPSSPKPPDEKASAVDRMAAMVRPGREGTATRSRHASCRRPKRSPHGASSPRASVATRQAAEASRIACRSDQPARRGPPDARRCRRRPVPR